MKMNKVFSKCKAAILSVVLILSIAPVSAAAADSTYDDTTGHWAEKAIGQWSEYGVLLGNNSLFRPNDPVTRAETAALINRVMRYSAADDDVAFDDVSAAAWYYDDVLRLAGGGIITGPGDGSFAPERNISREEAVVMIARAFRIEAGDGEKSAFPDADEISAWAAEAVQSFKDAGYIVGGSDGNFNPKKAITRAEIVTVLDNMVGALIMTSGEHDFADAGEINGLVAVNTAGAVVKNMKINGDLLIAAGVGDGDVRLDNVTVSGRVRVEGGGENSVYFNNCDIRELVVTKSRVRVALENGCVIEFALSLTGDSAFEIGGDTTIGTLTIIGEGVAVKMSDKASVGTLNADAGNTVVEMSAETNIGTANLNGETVISGSGSILTANINVNGCEIENKPDAVQVKEEIAVTIAGQSISDSPPSQPPSGVSSGSGGGGDNPPGGDPAPVFSSHSAPSKPNTPYGTAFAELDLPNVVTLYATENASLAADVTWDESSYDPAKVGEQTVTGAVSSVSDAALPSWAPATVSVTVTVLPRPVAATLVIKGEIDQVDPISEIIKGSLQKYSTLIHDQYGAKMTGQTVIWSIYADVDGVSVDVDGLVTVSADCSAESFTLRAQCGEASDTYTVTIGTPAYEQAPQVRDLRLYGDNRLNPEINNEWSYLDVSWTTPDSLPYPVRYVLDIVVVDDEGDIRGSIQSFEQDPNNEGNLNLSWNWNILDNIPQEPGSYRVRVTTVAVHDQELNSDPVYCPLTLVVTDNTLPMPPFTHLELIGAQGNDPHFMLAPADAASEYPDTFYSIYFSFGTGAYTFVEGLRYMYVNEEKGDVNGIYVHLWMDDNIVVEQCSARVFRFDPIIFNDEEGTISISRSGETLYLLAMPNH
jgi:hypothetical protein